MGRGRSGSIEQSQTKPKRSGRDKSFMVFNTQKGDRSIYHLPEKMLAEMKRLNPRDVVNILLQDD